MDWRLYCSDLSMSSTASVLKLIAHLSWKEPCQIAPMVLTNVTEFCGEISITVPQVYDTETFTAPGFKLKILWGTEQLHIPVITNPSFSSTAKYPRRQVNEC